jgi:hypothetical protein
MKKIDAEPLLICMTSTRNYGWITRAFLMANSLWADYIIIADQHSTDDTREIIKEFPKAVLINNNDIEYGEASRSELLINKAREIKGDKILFFLAIDEVLSANYSETEDWERIRQSKPGSVFFFQWANIMSDNKNFWYSNQSNGQPFFMARLFHDDGVTPYDSEGLDMHTHCIPYPKDDKNRTFYVNDFKLLHFGDYNTNWNKAKQRFYQFVDFNKNKRTATVLSRMYNRVNDERRPQPIPESWLYSKFDLFSAINTSEKPFFDAYVLEFINNNGIDKYKYLDVWEKSFLQRYDIEDPRNFTIKLVHYYFRKTRGATMKITTRIIDKILKIMSF